MASTAYLFWKQFKKQRCLNPFIGSDIFERDFVYVSDVVDVNLWFLERKDKTGVFNVGTGTPRSFDDMARIVLDVCTEPERYGYERERKISGITHVRMPDGLREHYQEYTCADLTNLRKAGYKKSFKGLEDGVKEYITWLNRNIILSSSVR